MTIHAFASYRDSMRKACAFTVGFFCGPLLGLLCVSAAAALSVLAVVSRPAPSSIAAALLLLLLAAAGLKRHR